MTIIEPNKNKQRINRFFAFSVLSLFSVALWSILIYNQTVSLSHDLIDGEREYKNALTRNAELKNIRYTMTDAKNLRHSAESHGFVGIKNPEYFEVDDSSILARR